MRKIRVIISGGGTGGHIFPAISIANAIRKRCSDAEILFVGAENRMEMEKVPAAGYPIVGLPVSGFDRKRPWRNLKVLIQLWKSLKLARKTVRSFRPDVVVGVGGYASGPTLWEASRQKIPVVIQEQNSYAGVTNKLLAKKADAICVAYEGMERFFPAKKIELTGNPVRQDLKNDMLTRSEAAAFFGLNSDREIILIIGGSLGARTINRSVATWLDRLVGSSVQLIWQTGAAFDSEAKNLLSARSLPNVVQMPFITRMDLAYKAADLVVSRAGASSISELCLLAKPAILIPSPNVAEDHQTKNAQALVNRQAALLVADADAPEKMMSLVLETVADSERLKDLAVHIARLAQSDSADRITTTVLKLVDKKRENGKV